jgi:hypothetical protein
VFPGDATTRAVIAEIRRAGKTTLAAFAQELEARQPRGHGQLLCLVRRPASQEIAIAALGHPFASREMARP